MTLDIGKINRKFNTTLQGMEDYLRQHLNTRFHPLILEFKRTWELEIIGDGQLIQTGNNLYKTALRIKLTPYQTKTYILPVPKYWSCSVIASFNYGVVRLFDGHNSVEMHSSSEDNEICLCNQDVCFLQLENTTASDIYIDLYRIEISPILRFKTHPDKLVYNTSFSKLFYFEKINKLNSVIARFNIDTTANDTFTYLLYLQKPTGVNVNLIGNTITPTTSQLMKFGILSNFMVSNWHFINLGANLSGIATAKTIEFIIQQSNEDRINFANVIPFNYSNTSTTPETYNLYATYAVASKINKLVANISTPSTGGSYSLLINGVEIQSGGAGVSETITFENLDNISKIQVSLAGDGTNAATCTGYAIGVSKYLIV